MSRKGIRSSRRVSSQGGRSINTRRSPGCYDLQLASHCSLQPAGRSQSAQSQRHRMQPASPRYSEDRGCRDVGTVSRPKDGGFDSRRLRPFFFSFFFFFVDERAKGRRLAAPMAGCLHDDQREEARAVLRDWILVTPSRALKRLSSLSPHAQSRLLLAMMRKTSQGLEGSSHSASCKRGSCSSTVEQARY